MKTLLANLPVILLALLLALLLVLPPAPCPAGVHEASVRFNNSGTCGSGTFVARDGATNTLYGITCAHGFFKGVIGDRFAISTWNDSKGVATLIDIDRSIDVALFSVGAGSSWGLDVVPIGDQPPDESCPCTLSGFPGGGPFRSVQGNFDAGQNFSADKSGVIPLYRFDLAGELGPGASGGSVVQDGRLVGVISATSATSGMRATDAFTADQTTLFKFSSKERTNCFGGTCKKIRIVQRGPMPSRPAQPAAQPAVQPAAAAKTKVFARPKEPPVPVPDVPPPAAAPDSASPASQADLDSLLRRIAALEKSASVSNQIAGAPGPRGPSGPSGPGGPAGQGADPNDLAAVKARIAKIEATRIPVVLYDGNGKVRSHKSVPLGEPLEFKFSRIK